MRRRTPRRTGSPLPCPRRAWRPRPVGQGAGTRRAGRPLPGRTGQFARDVEQASLLPSRRRALGLEQRRPDPVPVQDAGEDQAAEARADDGDVRLQGRAPGGAPACWRTGGRTSKTPAEHARAAGWTQTAGSAIPTSRRKAGRSRSSPSRLSRPSPNWCRRRNTMKNFPPCRRRTLTGLIYASVHGLLDLKAGGRMREQRLFQRSRRRPSHAEPDRGRAAVRRFSGGCPGRVDERRRRMSWQRRPVMK